MGVFDKVTLEIHYGGLFSSKPYRSYQGGLVEYIHDYDIDFVSYWELIDILGDLKLPSSSLLYYVIPGVSFDHGLRAVTNDRGVVDMIRYYRDSGCLPIYVESVDPLQVVGEDGQVIGQDNEYVVGDVLMIEPDYGDGVVVDDMPLGDGDVTQAEVNNVDVNVNERVSNVDVNVNEGVRFWQALKLHRVRRVYDFVYKRNENKRITVVCKYWHKDHGECQWRIHASPIGGQSTFQIKTFHQKHTCGRDFYNHLVTSRYIS
ncbi:hypothetical protein RJ639_015216 [Escallonia herrerae]|uniref:Transposase MuDR plant domain-containing protein n=1 Tax=Escallonia herrerae TaxID=1293975 RepID=A0AA88VLJ6_9ASTE|nr:hypothetical protein RJ639_015216 [Escallonia herrerae]